MHSSTAQTVRRRLAGVAFVLVPALLVWVSVSVYEKDFSDDVTVTVRTGSVGNEMHDNADVKLRGVVIGQVRDIAADGEGARLTLAIQPDRLGRIPADVTAQMLPTTLFGERFVALVPPPVPSAQTLRAGDVIPQDRSSNAIELEEVLSNVLPMLTAVQPQKLAATLNAVSQALEGRGDKLGDTLVTLDAHLKEFNPQLPTLNADIKELVKVSTLYADAAPDVLDALTDFTTTSGTLAEQQAELAGLYGSTTASAQDVTSFLRQNKDNLIRLSASGRPTLELLAEYSDAFPCTLRTMAGFVPAMDKALGKGTDKPGLHVTVKAVKSKGKYVAGRDTPVYDATGGPHCYSVPYVGKAAPTADTRTTPATDDAAVGEETREPAADSALGMPNSPQESRLVNELVAPSLEVQPQTLPDWSSVLIGPAFRGAEVKLK
ncbi:MULTISPECIES: MCE family protein [Streptomyces]|uniref:Phospholipid/cholesterol/gamma-HCH transport system substrate-binding protein n=1 Tax=Streptomyces clavifer TaxID=68188 RepID=A0ABS4V1K8_9ACTN|nr:MULTISPECIES: MCE family protein [Streptomyces]MBP2357794.1 phospholipid/cholesterol/gamma-HCH transport system substrate-binding protein [Streptomyces clavifer]MDX2742533.1 MCE family protein [Streptomyces sp. NRRL_B-2557]MDX3060962.1 MCE family protein [Streptomyces sp. ND04-05B]WRY85404.1 MCE family protein [Streptomyces clavifer]WUC31107.1 MCE family protein [Streptomyces clavifer]